MYVEFSLSQTMEQFLAAHVNAFNALGVPQKVMVDNLRCAVLRHIRGGPVEFNPRYLDFARHYGFAPVACAPAKGNDQEPKVPQDAGYAGGPA
jgi:transposase